MLMVVILAAPAVMCLLALLPLPYGYYTLLRIVVCGAGAFGAYKAFEKPETQVWAFALGGLAILFNPIIPIHLTREIWAPIDIAAAAVFGAAAVWLAPKIDFD